MPIEYSVSPDGRYVSARAFGLITDDDVLNYGRSTVSDDRIAAPFNELFDTREIETLDVAKETLAAFAELSREHPKVFHGTRTAVVVTDDGVFSLAEEFERMSAVHGKNIILFFRDDSTARRWLGMSDDLLHE